MTVPASLKIRGRAGLALSASIFALAVSHNAHAQSFPLCADGTPGPICEIEVTGGSGPIASTNSNINIITNSGTITGNPAIAMGQGSGLVVFNEGTITGTSGVAINGAVRLLTYVENSGTINGSVVVTDQPAPSPFTSGFLTFISDGGTVNGDVSYRRQLDDDLVDFVQAAGLADPKIRRSLIGFSSGGGFVLRTASGATSQNEA